jgi:hypothetical protein
MSTLTSLARALAVESGHAQPITTVRHVHLSNGPLVFIPLALAGEANAPLAAIVGNDRHAPAILIVGEPRDRTERFAFTARLADIVLPHIAVHAEPIEPADAPQIILPNPAAVGFTRLLGRSTRFRRTAGDYPVPASVPLLGRWLTFYATRSVVPGSSLLLPMTAVLAEHWATGQSPAEDLNLAALMGWIDPPKGVDGATAARLAEDPVSCPPAGPATDPTFDNEVLQGRLAAVRAAKATGRGYDRAVTALTDALSTQLVPVWDLVWRAIDLLRELPAAGHVSQRWADDCVAFGRHIAHVREGGPPQPRHDGAVAAASRLARLERVQEMVAAQRAYDDPLIMAEHRMTGAAFAGRVVAAEPDRLDQTGKRRTLRPRITVSTGDAVLAAPGAVLTSPARPSQEARLVEVAGALVVLELKGGMGRSLTPAPGSVPENGEEVCYATFSAGFTPPPRFPPREQTPWTHGGPPPEYEPDAGAGRAGEAWS